MFDYGTPDICENHHTMVFIAAEYFFGNEWYAMQGAPVSKMLSVMFNESMIIYTISLNIVTKQEMKENHYAIYVQLFVDDIYKSSNMSSSSVSLSM
jgi:hypothetical protein